MMSTAWHERLLAWKERTEAKLRHKWWLWPIIFAIELFWHHVYETTNHYLSSQSGRMFDLIRSTVSILNPIVVATLLSLLILVGLAVHAYFDTRKSREGSLIIELPDMADKGSTDHLRLAWGCCSRTIRFAHELLILMFAGYKEAEEKRCICRLITKFALPPRTLNLDELNTRLASQKEFSNRDFDALKKLFRGALSDYATLVEVIEKEGRVLWGEEGLISSPHYLVLLQRNAKCLEELEN